MREPDELGTLIPPSPTMRTPARDQLAQDGWQITRAHLVPTALQALRDSAFADDSAGQRCLLDHPAVRQTALALRTELIDVGVLPRTAVAIQAIAFDKNPATNWKVTWHQDLMFPFATKVSDPDYALPSIKDRVDYARPPRAVLDELLAVRLHLDDCGPTNGPLRVASGSHRLGVLKSSDIPSALDQLPAVSCLAQEGDLLLIRPLTLHASSPATEPKHRRVLHYVFHSGAPLTETWHRSLS
jgi:Phytanoyl-CoA dioxygenase (PhyH)